MKNIKILFLASLAGSLFSCSNSERADGYGNFEATEITISSEANGKLEFINLEEGQILENGAIVGLVDTVQPYLNKQQLLASKETVASKSGGVWSQVSVLNQQLQTAKTEQQRIQNMFDENAATQRQLDQANSQVDVLKKQIQNVETQNAPIVNEVKSIDAKVAQIEEQIAKSKITNPIKGTVLTKYTEPGEIVSFGKPLYKIADLEEMTLRVYISETQLPNIKIGQDVTVKIDSGEEMKEYKGAISWISASAEFTPKIIQTKEERVNLVYAVKVTVKNDGSLKIGMPAEMWIRN
ncbi:HlyD family secretion protein [Aequorivita antarctica]|uniref:HlyD family efflux transporter periplasmic adaptor subunit n=1 Tax=Aequorivita antarctica TaxID=153266 RepID=A0A5C6YWN0_9FLAO|nr:HlyD family efflux transporter periplasmic adaptor subunit [Aequorivita antarctica]TXD71990.1 HlyD family efflux transporter periplasmic adaptor subunit [Aequorivita antarctica]SRX72868.1 Multidrug resistance protein MdtN [Aequorivita antarctica]